MSKFYDYDDIKRMFQRHYWGLSYENPGNHGYFIVHEPLKPARTFATLQEVMAEYESNFGPLPTNETKEKKIRKDRRPLPL
jgi:hypothetical protein